MRGVVGLSLMMGGIALAFLVLIGKFPPASWGSNPLVGVAGTEPSFKDIGGKAPKASGGGT